MSEKTSSDVRDIIAIDLKSFYASEECVTRGLDPLFTNLVVADLSRTEKTICLAVSPSLKSFGLPGRCRLFEVVEKVKQINAERLLKAPGRRFTGESCDIRELNADPSLALNYITAPPRMSAYIAASTEIYHIYLRYIAPEDIHVYSVDEVFIDATQYLHTYQMTSHELAIKMLREIHEATGITATCGLGTNLYLAKVAMDIVAKHMPADEDGVRIASLDEMSFRRLLWNHRPLTDFWRIGHRTELHLNKLGIETMGDIALCSVGKATDYFNEDLLYKHFGVNAELLIDHAWGYEPCRISDIKAYVPESNSKSSGQVLPTPYTFEKARIVIREMADSLILDLVDSGLVTDQVVLMIGYDIDNLKGQTVYRGQTEADHYGRKVPKPAHGSENLGRFTSSSQKITQAVLSVYDRIVDPSLLIRRLNISVNHLVKEEDAKQPVRQFDLFTDYDKQEKEEAAENAALEKEKRLQLAALAIKKKYGKNALLKGTSFQEGARAIERNGQIGGHKG